MVRAAAGWQVKVQVGMDAITWMGITVWELGGPVAFVLFTGVSILPQNLSLGARPGQRRHLQPEDCRAILDNSNCCSHN